MTRRKSPRIRAALATACVLLPAGALCAPSTLLGQSAGRYEIALRVGSLSHSLLGDVDGTLANVGVSGYTILADVEAEASTSVGVQVTRRLRRTLDIRVRVARTASHMRLVAHASPVGGGAPQTFTFDGLGEVAVWVADVDVAWTPWRGPLPVAPYVFGGAGTTHWSITGLEGIGALPPLLESPLDVNPVHAFLPGVVAGAGLALGPFGPITLGVEIADHVSDDPLSDGDFNIGADFVGSGRAENLVHNVSLVGSVRFALGG
ncbi:MAG: hypothetical protein LJF04_08465 [Gemmatimonadetes bacterium]|nr:hypothetical protein [Gemmatimonadota bacterium]